MSSYYPPIWDVVSYIPSGKVATYGQVADLAGLPGRARLVSKALRAAPEKLVLPWHRVLRADGRIAFAAGSKEADEQRQRLLEEGVQLTGLGVQLKANQWQPDLQELLFSLKY
ncbi:Alkyltransferase-like protein [Saliniradius amylolyticus]|uniref:Alkyltransferase-like protein n=1 Tax=Saliniradius amylolyticus TaxID=2183582 RepID=A0A2S2E6Z9_9ALTE|nr:methylated-DNA--[protein]-cysteine S-methyltransferase [Saliniradius amylolyticus]AWL13433.1 Alkyltransferase-like protein [Saliniradius amylolyticus]